MKIMQCVGLFDFWLDNNLTLPDNSELWFLCGLFCGTRRTYHCLLSQKINYISLWFEKLNGKNQIKKEISGTHRSIMHWYLIGQLRWNVKKKCLGGKAMEPRISKECGSVVLIWNWEPIKYLSNISVNILYWIF